VYFGCALIGFDILHHSQIKDQKEGTFFSTSERGLEFYVEELVEEVTKPAPIERKPEVQTIRLPEPFLVVSRKNWTTDDEKFYVEVWDEPDFKAKRVF